MKSLKLEVEYKEIDLKLIKRLIVFLKPYKKQFFFALSLTLITSALAPLRPYLTKIAIDQYILKDDWNGLLNISLLIFLLLTFHGAIRYGMEYLLQWIGQKVLFDIRIMLFEHSQALSLRFYDNNPVGKLVTRVTNDVEVLNTLFSTGLVMIFSDILLIFWIVGFMLYINIELTLLTLSILPILFFSTFYFRKKVRVLFRDIRNQVSKMNSFLNEFITGISTIKIFNREKSEFRKFDRINADTKQLNIKTVYYYAAFFPVMEILSALALTFILYYTAENILTAAMTVGTLVAFIQYAEMFFRPVRDLTEKYTTLQSAMAASERIFGLLDTYSFIEDKKDATELKEFKDKIEFKDLSFNYVENKPVLKNVSFEVNKGETVAIVGATGSGKSTIINLILRFYDFEEGRICIDGHDIRDLIKRSLRDKIALVMQDVFLFSRTIGENISLHDENIDINTIKEAAEALGAKEFIEELPNQYMEPVMERGATLSAGQKQLISFCRAYAANPEILILDEATSNIDSYTEHIIEKSMKKLMKGRTSIVIAHRLSTVKRADRIIVLHHGEVREQGSHKELIEHGGIYAKLYKLQFVDIE